MESIVIIDDSSQFREMVAEHLPDYLKGLETESFDEKTFQEQISILEDRRKAARQKSSPSDESLFDSAAFVIIDNDLLYYDDIGGLDGEDLAYLVRCFSDAKAIVTLNTNANYPRFDLNLKPSIYSFASISVAADDLTNSCFWNGVSRDSYRPWAWPDVANLPGNIESRAERTLARLDEPLLDVLELSDFEQYIDRSYLGLLEGEDGIQSVRDFVRKSSLGLKPRDSATGTGDPTDIPDARLARIAACRMTIWLEYLLAGQHVLIDAPHLESRLPGTFEVDLRNDPTGLSGLYDSIGAYETTRDINPYCYGLRDWLDRDVWLWSALEGSEELGDWDMDGSTDLVFCEDISAFTPEADAKAFRAELPTSYPHRFVTGRAVAARMEDPDKKIGVEYSPRVRLLAE